MSQRQLALSRCAKKAQDVLFTHRMLRAVGSPSDK